MDEALQQALQVHYIKLYFKVAMLENTTLPEHKVSALRGGIGEMLLRANCIQNRECENCDFRSECIVQRTIYSQFAKKPCFVTTGESVGYVLECENTQEKFQEGEELSFQLILFGKTVVYFNQFLQAIHALGMNGLGKEYSRFQIVSIANSSKKNILDGNNVYMEQYQVQKLKDYVDNRMKRLDSSMQVARLQFTTPLTVKYNGEFLKEFQMESVVRSVKRRIYMLDCFEGIDGEAAFDKNYVIPEIVRQKVKQEGVRRFSSRSQSKMYLNGITGEVELEGLDRETLELLLVGELIHIGKNTSFGFGKYKIKKIKERKGDEVL